MAHSVRSLTLCLCDPGGARTHGPQIKSLLLYQLSYETDEKIQKYIANAYRLMFHGQTSVFDAVMQIKEQVPDGPEIRNITSFVEGTKVGIISKM